MHVAVPITQYFLIDSINYYFDDSDLDADASEMSDEGRDEILFPPREENPIRHILSAPSYLEEDLQEPVDEHEALTSSFDLSHLPSYTEERMQFELE